MLSNIETDRAYSGPINRNVAAGHCGSSPWLSSRVDFSDPKDLTEFQTVATTYPPTDQVGTVIRRVIDIIVSLALLVLFSPMLAVAALLIKADSRGPLFYRQERVGLNGARFWILKLRSMTVDAEATGPRWAAVEDPRLTRVGRWIRRARIDELPQLFNVLAGSMSVVGPRPERPHFSEQLAKVIPNYWQRVTVKPGITGWAQVNLPYCASVDDARLKVSLDLHYLERRTLALDLFILLLTIPVVITMRGGR
jgi:exopolysaccharide biosynthesis polyprenyl glycosylphosphotransferase